MKEFIIKAENYLNDQQALLRRSFQLNVCMFILALALCVECILLVRSRAVYLFDNGDGLILSRTGDAVLYRPEQVQDYVKTFHESLFNLDPGAEPIKKTVERVYKLSDKTVKEYSRGLGKRGFYSNLTKNSLSQSIQVDSVTIGGGYPYLLRTYGTLFLKQGPTEERNCIVTTCRVEACPQSEQNPYGLIVKDFKVEDVIRMDAPNP